jgi:hypothetical protein
MTQIRITMCPNAPHGCTQPHQICDLCIHQPNTEDDLENGHFEDELGYID